MRSFAKVIIFALFFASLRLSYSSLSEARKAAPRLMREIKNIYARGLFSLVNIIYELHN